MQYLSKYSMLFMGLILFSFISCGEDMVVEPEIKGTVEWTIADKEFRKKGPFTYGDADSFLGNFQIYGNSSAEGEGIVIVIENPESVVDGASFVTEENSVTEIIYIDQNKNRWTTQASGGTGVINIILFFEGNRKYVEGTFSGTLFNEDKGTSKVVENGCFGVNLF